MEVDIGSCDNMVHWRITVSFAKLNLLLLEPAGSYDFTSSALRNTFRQFFLILHEVRLP